MLFNFLLSPWSILLIIPLALVYFTLPYLQNKPLRNIPGPPLAGLSNLWLLYQSRQGRRFMKVDAAHKKYGPLVRIQPNHVSIADPAAIQTVYGHGNGFLKSEFYDAFVSIKRGLFNTRDRAEHTRKRKTVSHTFSAKSVGQFEQYMHQNLELFVQRLDTMANHAPIGGYTDLDALHWFNYLAFDIIGDLAFGAPFGMLEKGKDIAEVRMTPDAKPTFAPAIEVLNRRGEVSATVGCLPAMKPYAKYLPDAFFSKGIAAVENLAGIAVARVNDRLERPDTDRVDLLARLMEGRDEKGQPLGRQELTAEALTQLIAGSDTTSNTSCAILYHCLTHPEVIVKAREELDKAWPAEQRVPTFSQVKDLPYLDALIKESLRIHSTSSLGLPRDVPPQGITVTLSPSASSDPSNPSNQPTSVYFPGGTTLSVPSYTIHHSQKVWGPDADEYRPERWLADSANPAPIEAQKNAFVPFSYGPRSCVGRNVAEMELALIVATVLRSWDWELRQGEMETREGFLRKPLGLEVGIRMRGAGGKS
ncbi:benzoate para-hydroxylase [Eremomyces bilateralis CBS 781.70]|uniref:Benzoate 4-monooxygenase bphA n=1 Tax=Eremomyces bilateralis CBS 781.70 TaxID=1392243 RepID=A0A6G1FSF0_9PEZI|nr:benzoate para-hydroxylase [Eremomyces bilateralis CBS 781.70]KAF1808638.1 benzoate para-hydroxylase [Eremomyces bilateralis CBS 781.70]